VSLRPVSNLCLCLFRPRRGRLNRSGAAEADRDLSGLDDHGDIAFVVGDGEHALEPRVVAQDVDVVEGNVALGVSLTGFARVRSKVLAEDEHFVHKNQTETGTEIEKFAISVSIPCLCLHSLSASVKLQAITPYVSLSERLTWPFESL
jgi:hypothetical protein